MFVPCTVITTMSQFTIVMAIKCNTHLHGSQFNNLERFKQIGLRSYKKFLHLKDVKEFIVIVPNNEYTGVKAELTEMEPTFPWVFVQESKLLSNGLDAGWQRQQTSKLAVSSMVKTPFYLIVDDDTFLTRPFGYEHLFGIDDKRLILNMSEIDFPMWLLWSCKAGGIDVDLVQQENEIMAITPEIFVTDVVRDLVGTLEKKYGGSDKMTWQVALGDNKFTEYTLYWSYLISIQKAHTLYDTKGKIKVYGYPVTGPEHMEHIETRMARAFDTQEPHYFSFIQSSLNIPLSQLSGLLNKYLC